MSKYVTIVFCYAFFLLQIGGHPVSRSDRLFDEVFSIITSVCGSSNRTHVSSSRHYMNTRRRLGALFADLRDNDLATDDAEILLTCVKVRFARL